VLLAIVLTSVLVLASYGAAQVSYDAKVRVGEAVRSAQAARAGTVLLEDLLRNVRAPQQPTDSGFSLDDDRLAFVAGGTGPPLEPGYDWRIHVAPDSGGLRLDAAPVGRSRARPVALRLPGVTRWHVQVLSPNGTDWIDRWTSARTTPRAIAITFWHDTATAGTPIRLALSGVRMPTQVEGLLGED
jgi:hypothetical protein